MIQGSRLSNQLVALGVASCIASTGMPPLVAAAPTAAPRSISQGTAQVGGPTLTLPVAVATMEKARREALVLQNHENPKIARRARRTLLVYDIVTAKTTSERHEKVRQLPVTIERSPSTSGSPGKVLSFKARGKTRIQFLVPETPGHAETVEQAASGPSDESSLDECYEGEPPCIGWGEMEDLAIFAADAEAELEVLEAEFNAEYAAYQEYCNYNGWACGDDLTSSASGPSADTAASCVGETIGAAGAVASAVAGAVGARLAVQGGAAAGLTLTVSGAAWLWGSVAALGVVAVAAVVYTGMCYYRAASEELIFEPVGSVIY